MFNDDALAKIREAIENWERENQHNFVPERKDRFVCESGITVKRIYTPIQLAEVGFDYLNDLGFPGS